jgi:septal ring factor EnvC (AmiA/AmiB activator)
MTSSKKNFISLLVSISIIIVGVFYAESANIDEINTLLIKEKNELKKLKREISRQTSILNKMSKKEYSNLKNQRILDGQLKIKRRELKIYNWNLKINENKTENLAAKLNESKKNISLQQELMGRRIRMIYKEGKLFPVKIMFSSETFVDLLKRAKYIDKIMAYDKLVFINYENELKELNRKKDALTHAKSNILLYKKKATAKKKEILGEKKKKNLFLAKLNKEKKLNRRLRDELVNSSKQLNKLISRLETKMINGEGVDIVDKKGSLIPPVIGHLLTKFGRKRDKKLNAYIVSNGIHIQIEKGTAVRSVFNGKVLYTGTLEGYGNIIIVGHGLNYHSLYGHLDEITTISGKVVRSGQIIGRSGDTGSRLGESVYFEMRHNGKPIEPTAWLIKSKK